MDISVVIPVYNEAEALPELYRALADALDRLPQTAEIIFADDGSRDGSAATLDAFAESDSRVRVLHLSRNYGQTAALMAAIVCCKVLTFDPSDTIPPSTAAIDPMATI